MPVISESDLEKVRQAADIVQIVSEKIPLKRSGRNLKALCPFHAEKTPSFMVNPERQIYHCFGCGEGGNVFSFLMRLDGLSFPEAVERLADRFGIRITRGAPIDPVKKGARDILYRVNQLVARHFFENLHDPEKGKKARAYLERRKMRPEACREALLGYALPSGQDICSLLRSKNIPLEKGEEIGLIQNRGGGAYDFFRDRLIFTVLSPDGKILGFSGRVLDQGEPKYLNSTDSSLYNKGESVLGLHLAKDSIREKDQVVIVEGNFDQLRLYQEGIRNVVAPLGTALTERQVLRLKRFTENFVLIFDGDAAGQKAARRALEIFLPLGILPRAVTLKEGEDPDSFVLQKGGAAMSERISAAPFLLDRILQEIFEKGGRDPAGVRDAVNRGVEYIRLFPTDVEKSIYIQRVAQMAGLPETVVARETLKKAKKGSNFPESVPEDLGRIPVVERTLLEILVSEKVPAGELFREIQSGDFSSPPLGLIWGICRADFERNGSVRVDRILTGEIEESARRLISELAVASERWEGMDGESVEACVKRFQKDHYRDLLKGISREIREAEEEKDTMRVERLLAKKNLLLKEMTRLH